MFNKCQFLTLKSSLGKQNILEDDWAWVLQEADAEMGEMHKKTWREMLLRENGDQIMMDIMMDSDLEWRRERRKQDWVGVS